MTGPRVRSSKDPYSADGQMSRRTMSDVCVENFRKKVNSGILICNAATSYKESFSAKTYCGFKAELRRTSNWALLGSATVANYQSAMWRPTASQWNAGTQNSAYVTWKNSIARTYQNEHAINLAQTELSARLTEGIASLLVSFAERDKTKGMLLKALNYLRRPLHDVLRIYKRMSGAERLNKVNEWWLEGRYGWRPFIYDVGDIIDAQKADVGDRRVVKTRLPCGTGTTKFTGTDYSWYGLQSKTTMGASLVSYYDLGQTADFRAGMMSSFRKFGWYDVVGAGWDLVPYSFVVDWFCNIGEAARAMQAYAFIDERIGWVKRTDSVLSELTHSMVSADRVISGLNTAVVIEKYGIGTHAHYKEMYWERNPYTSFIPTIGLRSNLDWLKVVDAAALLRNLYNKVRRMRA